jgi:hypothetical protein
MANESHTGRHVISSIKTIKTGGDADGRAISDDPSRFDERIVTALLR